jgi:hypothetical protein
MHHPEGFVDQQRIDRPVSVAPPGQGDLEDTGAESVQWLCDIGLSPFGGDGQSPQNFDPSGKSSKSRRAAFTYEIGLVSRLKGNPCQI